MKITIRQLNSALSALKLAKARPETQKGIEDLIQAMLRNKEQSVELESGFFTQVVMKLSGLHEDLTKTQKRFGG